MKNQLFILLFSLLAINIFSQEKLKGNKEVITQERYVESFNKIVVKSDLKVMLSQGNTSGVKVETDENLQDVVVTRVNGGQLEIYLGQKIYSSKKLLIYVTVADTILTIETRNKSKVLSDTSIKLNQLNVMAFDKSYQKLSFEVNSANIFAEGGANIESNLNATSFTNISTKQNSSVRINLKTDLLNCVLNNSSLIKPVGNCKTIYVEAKENGNFSGKDMLSDVAKVTAFDRTDVAINALKTVELSAENNSEIYIYDNPEVIVKKFTDKATMFKK